MLNTILELLFVLVVLVAMIMVLMGIANLSNTDSVGTRKEAEALRDDLRNIEDVISSNSSLRGFLAREYSKVRSHPGRDHRAPLK